MAVQNELQEKTVLLEQASETKTQLVSESKSVQKELNTQLEQKESEVKELKNTIAESQQSAKAIEETITQSNDSLKSFEVVLAKAEKQLLEKDKKIQELTTAQKSGNSQLLSLQGEYDTLDDKYQKLLRPARSSKGKFIASVTYKKVGGKKIIRFKPSPNGSYRTVTKDQLAKSLEGLKKKHKDNLYIKVVIPQNSGLSYNEAWRFTINLQQKYDYYYNITR
mgnify:CR=1 FL=1